jgi:hypothetical protein
MKYREVMNLARKHQAMRDKVVWDMRGKGNTWEQIALVLGVTRQRAFAIYKRLKKEMEIVGDGGTAGAD